MVGLHQDTPEGSFASGNIAQVLRQARASLKDPSRPFTPTERREWSGAINGLWHTLDVDWDRTAYSVWTTVREATRSRVFRLAALLLLESTFAQELQVLYNSRGSVYAEV